MSTPEAFEPIFVNDDGLDDEPDALVDDYVEVEQRATREVNGWLPEAESLVSMLYLARMQLNTGEPLDPTLVERLADLLDRTTGLGRSALGAMQSVAERRPEVDRAVPFTSGEVNAGWVGRL
jgi:hypothetical protein